jgi:hypothetical protein
MFEYFDAHQYFLYYLWLKFGRLAAYPFGDDENDIDIKRIFQAHIEVNTFSRMVVSIYR